MSQISISIDNYTNFMSILRMMQDSCESVSIVNGKIIQTSKEKNILYDIDMTPIFGDETIYIDYVKNKYSLLDIFRKQSSKVELDIREKEYVWADKSSSFTFRIPESENMRQKPMSTESRSYKNMSSISKTPLLKCKFDQKTIEKIIHASKSMESKKFVFSLNEDLAKFTIVMGDTNSSAYMTVHKTNDVNVIDRKGLANFPLEMFFVNTESIDLEMGFNEIFQDRLTMKLSMSINGISTTMYTTQIFTEQAKAAKNKQGN